MTERVAQRVGRSALWMTAASIAVGCHSSTAPKPTGSSTNTSSNTNAGTTTSSALAASVYAAAAQVPDSAEGQPDRAYLEIQRNVPSFGGLFIDGDGTPTVYLTDTTQRAAAWSQVAPMVQGVAAVKSSNLRVRQADYDWRTLKIWHRMADQTVLTSGRVIYTDADEAQNRLVVGVADNAAAQYVMTTLGALGVPAKAIETVITTPPRPTQLLNGYNRPLIPGVRTIQLLSNGQLATCSVGFMTDGFGGASYRGFLTASHCTQNPRGADSTGFFQPSYGAHEVASVKTLDPPYGVPPIPGFKVPACRRSDIALMRVEDSVTSTFGEVASVTSGVTIGATPYNVVSTDYNATHVIVGNVMEKMGEATGLTSGVIHATGITTIENMILPSGQSYPECLSQQVSVVVSTPPAAKSGDSGGPVFADRGFPAVEAEGIVWGVSTTYVPNDTYLFSSINGFKTDAGGIEPVLH